MSKLRCVVPTCRRKFNLKDTEDGRPTVTFHRFPVNPHFAKKWARKCHLQIKPDITSKICSLHFKESDYNIRPNSIRRRLRATAIPSVNMPSAPVRKIHTQDESNKPQSKNEGEDELNYNDLKQKYLKLSKEHDELSEQNRKNMVVITKQTRRLKHLENKFVQLATKNGINEKHIGFDSDLDAMKHELEVKNSEFKRMTNSLSNLLSKTQLELLVRHKGKVHWTSEDMARAFPIYYFSKKCYLYLKYNLKFPLPSVEILERWAESNEIVLRVPAYEIFQGLRGDEDESCE